MQRGGAGVRLALRSLTRLTATGFLTLAVGSVLLMTAQSQATAADVERIPSYTVDMQVRDDGTMRVRETIVYDFGSNDRHGIIREIPVREPYDDSRDRVYRVTDLSVTSPSGAPDDVAQSLGGGMLSLRVGDPDRTVNGRQTYVFDYVVHGALNAFSDHDELYWDAVGDGWTVPVDQAAATVLTPAEITKVTCFSGETGATTQCQRATFAGNRANFIQAELPPQTALTVVVAVPKGQVSVPPVELAERDEGYGGGSSTGFYVDPLFGSVGADIGAAIGVTLLAAAAAFYGWLRTGRDLQYVGQVASLPPAPGQPVETRRRSFLGLRPAIAPEFTPPEGLRPGLVGTLFDERAQPVDVTATIVDLAVRGYLRIDEVDGRGLFARDDWRLVRLAGDRSVLRDYERELYSRLFSGRDEVRLSELKRKFASDLAKVEEKLYGDIVALGWYRRSPQKTRRYWLIGGLVVAGAGAVIAMERALSSGQFAFFGLVGVGLVLMIASSAMPARTATGSAMLARVLGFRRYLTTAEVEQIRFEEREQIFSRYLPYAIVFGETDEWAKRFAPLWEKEGAAAPGWYVGTGPFDPVGFGHRMSAFTRSTSGAISAQASSSSGGSGFSGGFSGGGGGGGGGGSW